MDLDFLRSLVAVADAGAITEAASRLGLTQPALTRRIQQLEQQFGCRVAESQPTWRTAHRTGPPGGA